jgi:hypothetical protein
VINNILLADNQLLLVDWEIGRCFEDPSSAVVKGTITSMLDTMSVASLGNDDPLPHDNVESAVYVLLKVLTQKFAPLVEKQYDWAKTFKRYQWDDPNVAPLTLLDLRASLWNNQSWAGIIPTTLGIFRLIGDEARAQLVLSLLSPSLCLPLLGCQQSIHLAFWDQQLRLRRDPLVTRGSRAKGD